ncbi:hypothetical protein R83H12_03033 [Fibrobacteria bacterium R8-3-H12]
MVKNFSKLPPMHHTAAKYRPTPNPAPQGLASYGGSNNPAMQAWQPQGCIDKGLPLHTSCKSFHPENPGSDVHPDNSAARSASAAARFFNFCGTSNSGNIGYPPPPPYISTKQTAAFRTHKRSALRRHTPASPQGACHPAKSGEPQTYILFEPSKLGEEYTFPTVGNLKFSKKHTFPTVGNHNSSQKHTFPPVGNLNSSQKHTFPTVGNPNSSQKTPFPPVGNHKSSQKHTFPPMGNHLSINQQEIPV